MESNGIQNDYLANVRRLETFNRNQERYPYLRPEEVKPVAEAFDNLFNTVEARNTENGNVGLFSKPKDDTSTRTVSEFMRAEPIAAAGAEALPPRPGERAGIGEITRRVVRYFQDKRIRSVDNPQIGRVLMTPSGVRSSLQHGYGREKIDMK